MSTPTPPCPNCGEPEPQAYCPACGQSQRDPRRSPLRWVADVAADEFAFEARTPRTVFALLFRPGRLTLDWIEGRRARYLGPVRLYVIAVALFFAVTFFLGFPFGPGPSLERLGPSAIPIGTTVEEIAYSAIAGRLQTVLTIWAFLMVPLFAVWMAPLHRGGRVFADHMVFSLHQHAVLLVLATVAWPILFLGRPGVIVGLLILAGAGVHTLIAYRRTYDYPRAWVRFAAVVVGWGAIFLTALIYGGWEFGRLSEAPYDSAWRFHAGQLWWEAHGRSEPADTAVLRVTRERSLTGFRSVSESYLLPSDAYRIADLEVEVGDPKAALDRIEVYLETNPDHRPSLGLASLAAARSGDTVTARAYAEAFLTRAEQAPPAPNTALHPRYVHFLEHARRLLAAQPPSPEAAAAAGAVGPG